MKAQLFLAAILCSALASCASTNSSRTYAGEYFYNFESSSFTPNGTSKPWCVDATKLKEAELPASDNTAGPWGTAQIVVRGTLSPKGSYCNLGSYERFLEITEIVSISNKKERMP